MAEATAFVRDHCGADAANLFVDTLDLTFAKLLRLPLLGRPWPTQNPNLAGLRRLVLPELPFSVFYRPADIVIEVVRVLHHARHIPPLLEEI